jgi:peroxiredoxin Q/BCP
VISDTQKRIVRAYGVWMKEPEGGRGDPFGTERTTFVIAPEGRIKAILWKVDPYTHDRLLLEALYS